MSPTTVTFPHPELTVIEGKPTNTSLQLLQRQLFTNARSVPSPRGGGNNGHLALLMPDAAYVTRAGEAFVVPNHPGAAPIHAANATAAQIAETIRLFNQTLDEHTLYHLLGSGNQTQGSASHRCGQHIHPIPKTHYGTLTQEDIESNRAALSDPWNPDDPIENLWKKIVEIQQIATAGNAPITDLAAITLTLAMFEKSGLLATTTQQWRVKPTNLWTWPTFTADFTFANRERMRLTTAAAAGYHGANSLTSSAPDTATLKPRVFSPTTGAATDIAASATASAPNVAPFVKILLLVVPWSRHQQRPHLAMLHTQERRTR